MKVIFFGTHTFAAAILQGLLNNPFFEVSFVITQPDRAVGRKQELQASPVKLLAQKHSLPIDQPESLKNYELKNQNSKLFIVAQYGLLIPKYILEAPKYGTINVHTSLLPKYRGASPIQSALLHGDTKTGLTVMLMDEGMDSGPILLQKKIDIDPHETYLELDERMAHAGVEALYEAIPKYISGELTPQPQDETQVTFCKKLSRDEGKIDWNKTTLEIYNQYRGLTPWPGIWTWWDGKRLKLLHIKPSTKKIVAGKVLVEHDILYVGTSDSALEIVVLQLEGKPAMNANIFLQGYSTKLHESKFD
ncbi:MAG: methionyl-tRNA formyltransferase [Candidatus Magasanikbacteria bacterium]|nr:methionyl-tRNA formyltransferase [Candidatus Magasanikbacteria bacterium]